MMRVGLWLLSPTLPSTPAGSVSLWVRGLLVLDLAFVFVADSFDWCAEQVYTQEGLELARATLVNVKGQTVYDELVKPTCVVGCSRAASSVHRANLGLLLTVHNLLHRCFAHSTRHGDHYCMYYSAV